MFKTRSLNCGLLLLIAAVITVVQMGQAAKRSCPENEVFTNCGANCQTECATLNEPCLIRHIKCPEGCYCNIGYARDVSGKCVEIKQCM